MRKSTVSWRGLLLLVATALVAFSCVNEDVNTPEGNKEEGIAKDLVVQVAIPSATVQQPQMRSIGETEENKINTIDVLAFRIGNDGKEYYDYYAGSKKTDNNTEGAKIQSFKVTVQAKSNQQRFVILTNAATQVKDLLTSANWKNAEKDIMLSTLQFALANAGDQWSTISASDYTTFPMWGESGKITITSATSSLNTIPLLRMVAKISVQLDETVAGLTGNFKVKDVRLYNTHTKGNIVPGSSVVVSSGTDQMQVNGTTIPADATKFYGPLVYSDFSAPGKTDVAVRGSIYTFETTVPADNNHLNATGLVIGGLYKNDTQLSYYRVDFLNSDGTFRDILRNFQYVVNIIAVNGRGHETPDEAWEGKGVNMQVEILEWNDSGMDDVVVDDQYFLSVNRNDFLFSIDAVTNNNEDKEDNILTILTDYPTGVNSGWKVFSIESQTDGQGTDWIKLIDPSGRTNLNARGEANVKAKCTLELKRNDSQADRTVLITIAAGRLRYPVLITQNTLEKATIHFYEGAGNMGPLIKNDTLRLSDSDYYKEITIVWTPSSADVIAYEDPGSGTYLPTSVVTSLGLLKAGSPAIITPGQYTYLVVLPYSNNPVGSSTSYMFIVSNGEQITEKRLTVYCTE